MVIQKIEELQKTDRAFFNSLLCYSSYTGREWTVQTGEKSTKEVLEKSGMDKDLNMRKAFELAIKNFNTNKFKPVSLSEDHTEQTLSSMDYKYEFSYCTKPGEYQAMNNLARAIIMESENPDGSKTLHVSYRGTDTKAQSFKEFFKKAYLDMTAYYDCFKPLEYELLMYIQRPENNIKKVELSGHSLGGALVQEFFRSPSFKSFQKTNPDVEFEGFTFGAPGSRKKNFYNIFPNMYHMLRGSTKGTFEAFKQIAESSLNIMGVGLFSSETKDERITQYMHAGDLVPIVGRAIYKNVGQSVFLKDKAEESHNNTAILGAAALSFGTTSLSPKFIVKPNEDDKFAAMKNIGQTFFGKMKNMFNDVISSIKKSFTFESHDMLRYVLNVGEHMKTTFKEIKESDPELRKEIDVNKLQETHMSNYHEFMGKYRNPIINHISLASGNDAISRLIFSRSKVPINMLPKAEKTLEDFTKDDNDPFKEPAKRKLTVMVPSEVIASIQRIREQDLKNNLAQTVFQSPT